MLLRENRPWTVAALDPKCRMRSQMVRRKESVVLCPPAKMEEDTDMKEG
jgi:hypothetical protein